MLYKIGITGNICSGKSACLKFLANQSHSFGINFDLLGHQVYLRNPLFYHMIKVSFTDQVVTDKNTINEKINRKALGNIVFSNEKKLKFLNSHIRPEMRSLLVTHVHKLEEKLEKSQMNGILFVEGALIIEGGFGKNFFNEIWMTYAGKDEIRNRFTQRLKENNTKEYDEEILNRILKHQMSEEDKMKQCSEIINTESDIDVTKKKYKELHEMLLKKLNILV
jgi:dephospho-CoA kinase